MVQPLSRRFLCALAQPNIKKQQRVMPKATFSENVQVAPYPLPISSRGTERRRLDDMHNGFARYLKQLTYAPLEKPSQILELGSGTGAWSVEAATTYPYAHVIAADITPLPEALTLPPNVSFRKMNFLDPFPFAPGSFDVVHMRFVMIHLPRPESYISRLALLLRPNGWLLLEEPDHTLWDPNGPVGPGVEALYREYYRYMRKQNVDPGVGARLKAMLKASKEFSEVNERIIPCFMNPNSTMDPALQDLGEVGKFSMDGVYTGIMDKVGPAGGITPKILHAWRKEVNDPGRDLRLNFHLTWSRKI